MTGGPTAHLLRADARALPLADESVNCAVTSPPYFGLRDYGEEGQIGAEALHDCLGWATGDDCGECYVCHIRAAAAEVWRVLRRDGTFWLNLGDSYARDPAKGGTGTPNGRNHPKMGYTGRKPVPPGLKPKDLAGAPWRVALALQADGWTLRSDVIWAKPNPMPESVRDRCTRAHEYLFMLTKGGRYYYDADAIAEPLGRGAAGSSFRYGKTGVAGLGRVSARERAEREARNRRTVWTVASQPYPGAHFAAFPPSLVEPCILAGCPRGGVVLDPFAGSGTTGRVAIGHGRSAVLCDLNADYLVEHAAKRTSNVQVTLPLEAGG